MTKKKDGSRFDELFGAVRSNLEDTPHSSLQKKQAKGRNPDYVRTTFYLSKPLHRRLKAAALIEEREMSDIVEELVSQWLLSKHSDI